jgi:hypothetical protein
MAAKPKLNIKIYDPDLLEHDALSLGGYPDVSNESGTFIFKE